MMESHYDTNEWAVTTTTGRRIFNYNFRMSGDEFTGWELLKSVIMQKSDDIKEIVYMWEKKGSKGEQLLRIGIVELTDWRSAQAQLHTELLHSMRTDIPRGAGKLAETGDVNYVAKEPKANVIDRIFFTRGNLAISVSSVGANPVDVAKFATILDTLLSEPPNTDDIERGVASQLSPKSIKFEAQQFTKVVEKLAETEARGGWLKVIAKDGEFKREDDTLYLTTEKTGKRSIGKYLIRK